jgi:hypothetical protein
MESGVVIDKATSPVLAGVGIIGYLAAIMEVDGYKGPGR